MVKLNFRSGVPLKVTINKLPHGEIEYILAPVGDVPFKPEMPNDVLFLYNMESIVKAQEASISEKLNLSVKFDGSRQGQLSISDLDTNKQHSKQVDPTKSQVLGIIAEENPSPAGHQQPNAI